MAGMVRPRYHVASDRDVFFARAPYLNRDLGAGMPTYLISSFLGFFYSRLPIGGKTVL